MSPSPTTDNALQQARTLLDGGERVAAADIFRQVLATEPDNAEAWQGLGIVAWQDGRLDEARDHLRKAVTARPDDAGFWCLLGDVERMAGDFPAAQDCLRRALELQPQSAIALNNLGMVYLAQERFVEAATLFMGAAQVESGQPMIQYNLGIALKELNHLDEAIEAYRKAVAMQPDFAEAHVNLAIALLLDGQLEEGFEEYEWRHRTTLAPAQARSAPEWDGLVDPRGTLLLHAEQGIGDTIQMARYIPFIAKEGMRVVVQCPAALENLLQGVEGVASTYRPDEPLPPHTAQVSLATLPRLFGTRVDRIPRNIPYLQASFGASRAWRERLDGLGETIKIGLRWAGNPANTEDRRRSIPLALFEGMAGLPQLTYVSLDNQAPRAEDAAAAEKLGLVDFSADLADLTDTAALIANLDLVISVDTAVLHLAGALGRPAWALLRYSPHWPWLLGRSDSPWYPSLHLFRQERAGDWRTVMERVAATLAGAMRDSLREA